MRIVSGGTDNHLLLVDVSHSGLTGKDAQEILEQAAISLNRNVIPYDPRTPQIASGIRIGTPAVTTRGMKEGEMVQIVSWITDILTNHADESMVGEIARGVKSLCRRFPIHRNHVPLTVYDASTLG